MTAGKTFLWVGLVVLVALNAGAQNAAPAVALVAGTIYTEPSAPPVVDGVVVIQNGIVVGVGSGRAVRVPPSAQILDCKGLTVTAGLWNSHVHFTERKWANAANIEARELTAELEAMLTRYGFTSVFDTGSMWENTRRIRDRVESGEVAGPHIRSTGEILIPSGGTLPDIVFDVTGTMHVKLPEVATESEGRNTARKLLDAGVDGIKLYAETFAPPILILSPEVIRGAVAEAHASGKLVFAHPSNREGLLNAVRGGVDILVHTTPQTGSWTDAMLDEMIAAHVTLIPTLKLWRYELRHDRASARERFTAVGVGQLRAWRTRQGSILFGTDVGYMSEYNPTEEYELMSEAGMNFREILASLTTAPASRFGAPDVGRIAVGKTGDLTVLKSDPVHDVRAFGNVAFTIRGGNIIYQDKRGK